MEDTTSISLQMTSGAVKYSVEIYIEVFYNIFTVLSAKSSHAYYLLVWGHKQTTLVGEGESFASLRRHIWAIYYI